MKQRKGGEREDGTKSATLSRYVRPRAGLAKSLFVCQNIRSISSTNMDEFKRLLTILNSVDIIALQEVWDGKAAPTLPGFNEPYMRCRSGQRGGGVALYVKSHLNCKEVSSTFIQNYLETIAMDITTKGKNKVNANNADLDSLFALCLKT